MKSNFIFMGAGRKVSLCWEGPQGDDLGHQKLAWAGLARKGEVGGDGQEGWAVVCVLLACGSTQAFRKVYKNPKCLMGLDFL